MSAKAAAAQRPRAQPRQGSSESIGKEDNAPPAEPVDGSHHDINIHSFDELRLDPIVVKGVRDVWAEFIAAFDSKGAAGVAIFTAIFEAASSIQPLFTSERFHHSTKFMVSLGDCIQHLDDPAGLKAVVESLGFSHMALELQLNWVVVFRSSIMDMLMVEVGDFPQEARDGMEMLLNYIGGALIFVKTHYAERLRVLQDSWKKANDGKSIGQDYDDEEEDEDSEAMARRLDKEERVAREALLADEKARTVQGRMKSMLGRGPKDASRTGGADALAGQSETEAPKSLGKSKNSMHAQFVPTTYPEMFRFNAAVMGFGHCTWMNEVLEVFSGIVSSMSQTLHLQQDCSILALRIYMCMKPGEQVNLSEYKACMLASLRSLLPKDWSTTHEVSWNWLWENVQRIVTQNLSKPGMYAKALHRFMSSMDDIKLYDLRKQVYEVFFVAAPTGQDYFKQSTTRLHFIADRVMSMAQQFFEIPIQMVDDISALGLRHVGYGIPTELFQPFVTAFLEVIATFTDDKDVHEAFSWSLHLLSGMLVRTIVEGSTIVMKAIHTNSTKTLQKAISTAPRGKRSFWMLTVQVGSQSISPLEWAIESGSLEAAKAMIEDLLTFRADRDRYYYGMEHLFTRHPDIVKILCTGAPTLLVPLLDGLVWRSRDTTNCQGGWAIRRVNFYIKYLMIDQDGNVSKALSWITASADCKIINHPVIVLVSDTMWKGIVRKHFLFGRLWFIISLAIYLLSQSVLPKLASNADSLLYVRVIIFSCRIITYFGSLLRLFLRHTGRIIRAYYRKDVIWKACLPVPKYLQDPSEIGTVILMGLLCAMISTEPMIRCWNSKAFPTTVCEDCSDDVLWWYSVFSMIGMVMHWALIIDLAVFSTKLTAFLLVCTTVFSEVSLFLIALTFLLLTFGSAISCLRRDHPDFKDVPSCLLTLFSVAFLLMPRDYRELQYDPPLLFAVFLFVTASVVILLNLLIAQLNCSYEFVYQDMMGFARLNRAAVIVESLETCSPARWQRFVRNLKLNQRVEFNEGDIGLAGAIQLNEPASTNPITTEQIIRYGGTCSPDMRWPDDESASNKDRFERMEALVRKALKKVARRSSAISSSAAHGGGSGSSNYSTSSGSDTSDALQTGSERQISS